MLQIKPEFWSLSKSFHLGLKNLTILSQSANIRFLIRGKYIMNSVLYIVATPIGNLDDMTFRAVKILKEVDLIAAENISHSKKLLSYYGINTKLTSYHDNNKEIKTDYLINKLKTFKSVALITDAGTPCISDPGYLIVKRCRQEKIKVVPIPGASAAITALSASGFATDSFKFIGFLPNTKSKKKKILEDIVNENITTIMFDSPNRVLSTLETCRDISQESKFLMARELTKIYEELIEGTPSEIIDFIKTGNLKGKVKGEVTLVYSKTKKSFSSLTDIQHKILQDLDMLDKKGLSTKELAKIISKKHDLSKKLVYKTLLSVKDNQK
jgi:16S rRNA (cytidine1402-2'-O)-methyltransferase